MMLEQELMRMLAVSTCIGLILQATKIGAKLDRRSDWYRRLQPLVAMLLGALLGCFALELERAIDRALWGMIAGGFSSGGYGIVQALVRGARARAESGALPQASAEDVSDER